MKQIHMTTTGPTNSGSTTRKTSESINGQGPAPVFVDTGLVVENEDGDTVNLGFYQGTRIMCTNKADKVAMNKALNAKRVARTSGGCNAQGAWVSGWTRPDGVLIESTKTDLGVEFYRAG